MVMASANRAYRQAQPRSSLRLGECWAIGHAHELLPGRLGDKWQDKAVLPGLDQNAMTAIGEE
jgi:hypothetical protein